MYINKEIVTVKPHIQYLEMLHLDTLLTWEIHIHKKQSNIKIRYDPYFSCFLRKINYPYLINGPTTRQFGDMQPKLILQRLQN